MAQGELILVTGATGAVGPAVVRAALREGYRVRSLSRRPPEPGVLPSAVDIRIGDVGDSRAVASALDDVAVVIHLAGFLHVATPTRAQEERFDRVNARATAELAQAAASAGARRFVMASTIAVYGVQDVHPVTENSVPRPDTEYARSKLRGEQAVLEQPGSHWCTFGVVVRLAAVYGPRVRGNYLSLVRALSRRRFVPLGSGANRRTLVFDEDAAQAMLLAARHPPGAGRIYNVTDGTCHTVSAIVQAICDALGRPLPALRVPAAPVRAVAEAAYTVAPSVPAVRRVRTAVVKYLEDAVVDGSRIQRELGFAPGVPLAEGWCRTVSELRRHGLL